MVSIFVVIIYRIIWHIRPCFLGGPSDHLQLLTHKTTGLGFGGGGVGDKCCVFNFCT